MHNQPLCDADRVLFVAGDFDLIARPEDVEKDSRKLAWLRAVARVARTFGYRMLRETIARF